MEAAGSEDIADAVGAGLMDVDFRAWDLSITGLHNTWLKNLHVLRHLGLKDIRVVIQLITDLSFNGNYTLSGTGLSMIPVTGRKIKNVCLFVIL